MKNSIFPTTLALLIVAAMFVLASLLGGCAKVTRLQGDKHYTQFNYSKAILHYEKALAKKKNQSARLRLADAYRRNNQTHLAEKNYRKVVSLPVEDRVHFAEVLMANGKYADARKLIRLNLRAQPGNTDFQLLLASCDSLPVYLESQPLFEVERLPSPINKLGSNFGATLYGEGIVFASERPSTHKNREAGWTGQHFLDLFYAHRSQLGEWSEPTALQGKVNSPYHEGIAAFDPDGTTMFFTRNNFYHGHKHQGNDDVNHLQLYYAQQKDGAWKNVKPFPFNSDAFSTGQPVLAEDGQTLFFISDMPGGYGGTDLYVCSWANGEFSDPVNLGPEINTPGNEMFPTLQGDAQLYFASDGHPGLGGLDIFTARFDGLAWGQVVNMRAPLNSSRDDFSFVIDATNETGYFSSNRNTEDGLDEIFSFGRLHPPLHLDGIVVDKVTRDPIPGAEVTLWNPTTGELLTVLSGPLGEYSFPIEADQQYVLQGEKIMFTPDRKDINTAGITAPVRTVLLLDPVRVKLKGVVLNNRTGKPIASALVELKDHSDQSVRTLQTPVSGKFEFSLTPGSAYTLRSSKRGYNDDYKSVSTQGIIASETIYKELRMDSLEIGKAIAIENIYYDFDKHNIRNDAALELDKLVRVLKENPEISIELGSHTDARGSDPYNLRLSDNRAHAAVDYIISRGIATSRLVARGYGETQLVNGCRNGAECSEADHQLNRRTEFKVTSYGSTAMHR